MLVFFSFCVCGVQVYKCKPWHENFLHHSLLCGSGFAACQQTLSAKVMHDQCLTCAWPLPHHIFARYAGAVNGSQTVIACQGMFVGNSQMHNFKLGQWGPITCPAPLVINILSATYGRSNNSTCLLPLGEVAMQTILLCCLQQGTAWAVASNGTCLQVKSLLAVLQQSHVAILMSWAKRLWHA